MEAGQTGSEVFKVPAKPDPKHYAEGSDLRTSFFQLGAACLFGCLLAVTLVRRKAERVVGLRALLDGCRPQEVLPCFSDPARYLSFNRLPVQPAHLETVTDEDGTLCHTYHLPGPSLIVHEVQSSANGARIVVSSKGAAAPTLIKYDLQPIENPLGTKIVMVGKLDAPWYRISALAKQLEAEEQFRLERIVEAHSTTTTTTTQA